MRALPTPELLEERANDDFSQLTPMAGIALKAPEDLIEDTPVGSGDLLLHLLAGIQERRLLVAPRSLSAPDRRVRPGELDNYELGLKLEMFDHRVLFNTAFFYSKYEDIQLTVLRVNPASLPGQPDAGSTIANAGKATSRGSSSS